MAKDGTFLELGRYDRFGLDTETKGQGRNVFPVGCGVATPDGQKRYMRWGHPTGNNCTLPEFQRWAKRELGDSTQTAIFHAAPYDLRVFANVGIKVKAIVEDTGVIAALLNEYEPKFNLGALGTKYIGQSKSDEKINKLCADRFGGPATRKAQAGNYWRLSGDELEEYGEDDPELTLKLYDHLRPVIDQQGLQAVYQLETMVIPVLVRMYLAGVKVDVDRAKLIKHQMDTEFAQIKREWDKHSGGIKFSERKRMIQFLLGLGIKLPETAKSTEERPSYSIAKDILMGIDHPVGGLIRRMRQLDHYSNTFIQSYLLDNVDDLGFVFPQFHQVKRSWGKDEDETGTITGRFSSSGGLNAQNIPARDKELAPLIRSMFIPMNEDSMWVKGDYNSIEYRFFAHYAGGALRKSYQDNPLQDLHQWVADICGIERSHAKNVNFAKLYGAGIPKLAKTLGISEEATREIMLIYDDRVPEAKRLYNKAMNRAAVRGYITTWGGRRLRFEPEGFSKKRFRGTFKALNKVCQGSSADLIKHAMVVVDQAIDWNNEQLHLTVHDELDLSVPRGDAGYKASKRLKECMEDHAVAHGPQEITVPIVADLKAGENWGAGVNLEEAFGQ